MDPRLRGDDGGLCWRFYPQNTRMNLFFSIPLTWGKGRHVEMMLLSPEAQALRIRDLSDLYMEPDLKDKICDELGDDVTVAHIAQSHFRCLLVRCDQRRALAAQAFELALQRWQAWP